MHELRVAARAFGLARRRRRAAGEPLGRDELERLGGLLPSHAVTQAAVVDVPVDQPPWANAGVELQPGETVSTFAAGRVYLSRAFDVWVDPAQALWFRVGGRGPIFRGTRSTHTFTAGDGGTLELANGPPGDWADRDGAQRLPAKVYKRVSGELATLVVRWAPDADPDEVLRELSGRSAPARAELDRRAADVSEPPGWTPLWQIGPSEIYSGDESRVECTTHRDVGLVRHDVDFPLTEATRLRWRWRVDELPSELPEDILPTHDYLSIALEFDNGQDLTWHWSAELPAGYHYRCPLPPWRDRETHFVVRTGDAGLGRWLDEERAVLRDYERAVGAPPERIVGVWLIAVSLFQRRRGRCAYAGIELHDGDRVERVLEGAGTPG